MKRSPSLPGPLRNSASGSPSRSSSGIMNWRNRQLSERSSSSPESPESKSSRSSSVHPPSRSPSNIRMRMQTVTQAFNRFSSGLFFLFSFFLMVFRFKFVAGWQRRKTSVACLIRIIESIVQIQHPAGGVWSASALQPIRIALASELDAQSHSIAHSIRTQHPRLHLHRFFNVDRVGCAQQPGREPQQEPLRLRR